jgi:hypothetical protein
MDHWMPMPPMVAKHGGVVDAAEERQRGGGAGAAYFVELRGGWCGIVMMWRIRWLENVRTLGTRCAHFAQFLVDLVIAERLVVTLKTKAAQPSRYVHAVILGSEERQPLMDDDSTK